MKVILASSSPRRREILNLIGFKNFDIFPPEVQEVEVRKPSDVLKNAKLKALWVEKRLKPKEETLIIASDTAVFLEGKFLGKPKDVNEAKEMLRTLSGKKHTVYTAVMVLYRDKTKRVLKGRNDKTYVWFKKLSDREIEWYLQTGEPLDKAGAYGIQGYGAIFIEKIFGDYFTVMGLSPRVLYNLLKEILGEERSLKLLKGYNRTF
jgi:septum formation protein